MGYNEDVKRLSSIPRNTDYVGNFSSQSKSVQDSFRKVLGSNAATQWSSEYALTQGGSGGHGGEGGGMGSEYESLLMDYIKQQMDMQGDLNTRAKGMEDLLDSTFREYIRGERNLGEQYITDTLDRIKPGLVKQAGELQNQNFRAANRRGLYRSSVPDFANLDIDKALLEDLGNIEKDVRLQTQLINIDQERFGASGLSGLAGSLRGSGTAAAGLAGQGISSGLNYSLGQSQLAMQERQLAESSRQFDQGLAFQNYGLQQNLAAQRRSDRNSLYGGIGSTLGSLGGAGIIGASL